MDEQVIFSVRNHHSSDCGKPPSFVDGAPSRYLGYFENSYGEQAIFVYDRDTVQGTLYMGDAGWETPHTVENGRVAELIVSEDERAWLSACWRAATEFVR